MNPRACSIIAAGIFARWKQWMSDEHFSQPIHLLDWTKTLQLAQHRPPLVQQTFGAAEAPMRTWIERFALHVETCDGPGVLCQELAWLRRAASHQEDSLKTPISLDQIVSDIQHIGANRQVMRPIADARFPVDVLVQLFPGHDFRLPVETLIGVQGSLQQQLPARESPPCVEGSLVIIRGSGPTAFFMGTVASLLKGGQALVQWMAPRKSKEASGGGGRKRMVADVYGSWQAADNLTLADLSELQLPSPIIEPSQVLMWAFELEEGGVIPFSVFDELFSKHKVDCTGFSISMTARGNLYRAHRLMSAF